MIIYLILQQLQNIFSRHHNPCFHLPRVVEVIEYFPYLSFQLSEIRESKDGIDFLDDRYFLALQLSSLF